MPNRLVNENSPYLLQHASNPVDWYPWGEEALKKAVAEDKPIFLSIGYAACHWCHVMEHESFEDEETAAMMNKYFVNIKVDREQRPDLDTIYMQAIVAMTGRGGWPMSIFLTPQGAPFYGGTYFPPEPRYRMPSFKEVLLSVHAVWQNDRQKILDSSEQIRHHLQPTDIQPQHPDGLQAQILPEAVARLAQSYDWKWGGWGQAPKFPQPMVIEFLLRQAERGDRTAFEMARHALQAMSKGGMYDVVGGGFARYSVDNYWLIPHFEKMLYDNAQLALVYLHAFLLTDNPDFRRVCEETLNFVQREMTHPQGGFYSSLDADSEGVEGKFYVWSSDELRAVLHDPEDERFFWAAYGVTDQGNFEGKTSLQRALDDGQLSEAFHLPKDAVPARLAELHAKLLRVRSQRVRPGTDDKILVSWNALMLSAFAEAGRYLQRTDYTQVASKNAEFLLTELFSNDRLLRTWRIGKASHNAYLEDYAALILALLTLYQSDPQTHWYTRARALGDDLLAHFADPQGGFFDTRDDHETLLLRPKDVQDNAMPSGNALATLALLQLATYDADMALRAVTEKLLAQMTEQMQRYPTGFGQWLCAADFAIGPVQEVAILGEAESPQRQALVDVLWEQYRPRLVAAISAPSTDSAGPKLLEGRGVTDQNATAYVCQSFTCQYPATEPAMLKEQLSGA